MPRFLPQFTDPVGPGTSAWNAFDDCILELIKNGRTKRFYNRRDYMKNQLLANGMSQEFVTSWYIAIERKATEDRHETLMELDDDEHA